MTWQHYLTDTAETLIPRHVELCEDIASRIEELGFVQAEEKRKRAEVWKSSEFTSASGRDSEASAFSAEMTADIIKLRSELEALREERDLIRWILDAVDDP